MPGSLSMSSASEPVLAVTGEMASSKALLRPAHAHAHAHAHAGSPSDAGGVSLRGQSVLAEEHYIHSVSSIIQRDFFPDLDRLRAENEYLDALQSGKEDWIEATVRALVRAERRADEVVAANAAASLTPARARSTPTPTPTRTPLPRVGRVPGPSPSPAPSAASTPRRPALGQRGWDDDQTPLRSLAQGTVPTPYSRYPDTRSTAGPSRYAQSEAGQSTLDDERQLRPPADTSLSLTAFQRAYTSEDNASFSRLLQLNAMKRRERYAWAYQAEQTANQKRIVAEEKGRLEAHHGQRLAIAAALESDPNFKKKLKGKERQLLIEAGPSTSEGQEGTADPDKEDPNFDPDAALRPVEDTRPASFPSWRFTARNAFHFGPDANINTYDRSTSSLPPAASSSGANPAKSNTARKVKAEKPGIRLNALRMPDLDGSDSALRSEAGLSRGPDSPSSSRIDAAIAGRPQSTADGASHAGDNTLDDSLDFSSAAFASPRVNGYGFVTPLAQTPRDESVLGDYLDSIGADVAFRRRLGLEVFDEDGERRVDELKRWGRDHVPVQPRTKEETEEVYDGSFRVPPAPRRDQIGRRLAQQSSRSKTAQQTPKPQDDGTPYGQARYTGGLRKSRTSAGLGSSSTPRSSAATLSPAGRLLLERTSGKGGKVSSRLGDTLLGKRGHPSSLHQGSPSAFGATRTPTGTGTRAGTEEDRKRQRRQDVGVRGREVEIALDRLRQIRWTPRASPAPE
ncbi:unnamed protein product [Tilletia laevis]|uniref:Nuclear protein DGCR14 n=1 Tax=Tilletia laevis TaxID=157183 RepID=A0A9N8LDT1_9BASI|nr:unnamed protein product [Tilletia laevis]